MNSEELEAVRTEMRNRMTVLAKNLADLDRFNEFASNLAPDVDADEMWRKFTAGELTFDDSAKWRVEVPDMGTFILR